MWDKWCWNQWNPIVYKSRSFDLRLPCMYLALCTEIPSWLLKIGLCRKFTQMCYISKEFSWYNLVPQHTVPRVSLVLRDKTGKEHPVYLCNSQDKRSKHPQSM